MTQLVYKIFSIALVLLAVQGEIILNTHKHESILTYEITSSEQLVVIGFEGQEEIRDYLFCRLSDCSCEDMVSKGPRSHPQYNDVQTTANIYCENSNTMTFERIDNGFKPYLWGQQQENPQRIAQETTANATDQMMTTTGTSVTYDETDMTASKAVSSELTLKWKFDSNTTNATTIEMCVILSKKAWVGIGFGSSMSKTDMFAINIVNNIPVVLDLYSTSTNQPPQDTSQDVSLVSYNVTDSAVSVRVKRALSTGDTAQDTILQQGGVYTWAYASSSALTMENHGGDYKVFTITLSTSGTQVQTSQSYIIGFAISLIAMALIF